MNNQLVGLFFGIGVAGWTYYQVNKRMSDNKKAVWISTILAGAVGYFVLYSLFAWVIGDGSGGGGGGPAL